MSKKPTPGPWFAGAQNDALFIVAGRQPAVNNDYPWHDAPRVALAKVYGPSGGDCLPVNADANARLLAAAPDLLEALTELVRWHMFCHPDTAPAFADARTAIARATGEQP